MSNHSQKGYGEGFVFVLLAIVGVLVIAGFTILQHDDARASYTKELRFVRKAKSLALLTQKPLPAKVQAALAAIKHGKRLTIGKIDDLLGKIKMEHLMLSLKENKIERQKKEDAARLQIQQLLRSSKE